MKNIIKNNYKYVITFIFVFILIWWIGSCRHFGDPINNYGFSHALINGEIPYLDFNTISTPLYSFFSSLWTVDFIDTSLIFNVPPKISLVIE